jgi:DNA polymerase-3 subunit gamma/tau
MNLVLYRKYRPKTFSEFIGQEHVVKTLTNQILEGMISHAYLFYGPRGTGKTTIARLFAKAINCQNRKGFEPCNQCPSCQEINQGRAIDLIEIDAASHRGIDEVRDLKDGINFPPTRMKYKVFIIDEAHQLTKEAANALLKTLEEPPPHVIFILATTEVHKMIPTILSRCQRFDFRKLTVPEILKKLKFICQNEKIEIEKEAMELIAINSAGSIRDAESFLDQAINFSSAKIKVEDIKDLLGLVEIETISNFCDLLIKKDSAKAIEYLNEISEKGMDLEEFVKSLINYFRQALILKIIGEKNPILAGLTKEELEKLKNQAQNLKEEEIRNILNKFLEAQNKMKFSPILQLPLELAIVEITTLTNN